MKLSRTLTAMAVAGALSVAGLAAVTMATGTERAFAAPGDGPHGKKMCHKGKGGKHGKYGSGPRGPERLAARLSAMETEIGIRAEQLDDWRDFTDSLQAVMKPPFKGMFGKGGPGKPAAGEAKPFSFAEGVADRAEERAKDAEKLKAAIAKLRTTLTPEQLEKVSAIETRFQARMMRHHGPRGPKMKPPADGAPKMPPPPPSEDGEGSGDTN